MQMIFCKKHLLRKNHLCLITVVGVILVTISNLSPLWRRPEDHPGMFIPRTEIVNPLDFNVLMGNNVTCKDKVQPFLTVLVLSMHQNIKYRNTIRATWGNVSFYSGDNREMVKVVFLLNQRDDEVLNQTVKVEAEEWRDIIMFGVKESYYNLTYKVLMGFKWVKENCPQTKFVMKVDEDTFVNIPMVLNKLRTNDWNTKICGPYFSNEHCQREGKFKVAVSSYPFEYYPPHVKGNIYFMPTDIALKLLHVSYYMPYCNMEDAYITGILTKAIGGVGFQTILGKYYCSSNAFKGCSFISSQKMASREIEPNDASLIWNYLRNPSLCTKETFYQQTCKYYEIF